MKSAQVEDFDAQAYGLLAHPLYLEPVFFDAFSIRALVSNISKDNHNVLRGKVRIGATLIKPKNTDTEIFADYSASGWYEGKTYRIGAGLNGRAITTVGVFRRT